MVTINTDEGLEGHCFLGSSSQGADVLAVPMMKKIKPLLLDRNPLAVGAIWQDMRKHRRHVAPHDIGAVDSSTLVRAAQASVRWYAMA